MVSQKRWRLHGLMIYQRRANDELIEDNKKPHEVLRLVIQTLQMTCEKDKGKSPHKTTVLNIE
jgi:hypothetical protein